MPRDLGKRSSQACPCHPPVSAAPWVSHSRPAVRPWPVAGELRTAVCAPCPGRGDQGTGVELELAVGLAVWARWSGGGGDGSDPGGQPVSARLAAA